MFVVMKYFESDACPIFATPYLALAKVRAEADARTAGFTDASVTWDGLKATTPGGYIGYEIVPVESDIGQPVA